jgi:hypothetical protein
MKYMMTHVSVRDQSPAMFISEDNDADTYVLMNEDGETFTVEQDHWISLAELEQEEYENEYFSQSQSGEEYMADYLNSDSNIAYLNGY